MKFIKDIALTCFVVQLAFAWLVGVNTIFCLIRDWIYR